MGALGTGPRCFCYLLSDDAAGVPEEKSPRLRAEMWSGYREHLQKTHDWCGFVEDVRQPCTPLALLRRPGGAALGANLRQGDAVIFGRLHYAFIGTVDLVETLVTWDRKGVSLILVELGLDTSKQAGQETLWTLLKVERFNREQGERRMAAVRANKVERSSKKGKRTCREKQKTTGSRASAPAAPEGAGGSKTEKER